MKKILIIKHGSFGDIVLSMYAIFSIFEHFKNCEITILTDSKYSTFFKKIPFIRKIKIDNRSKIYNFNTYFKLLLWFKRENFEWVFDLQTSNRTNIYFYIFSIFSKFKWNGIARYCSHPHLEQNRVKLHTIERHKQQLKKAGIKKFKDVVWKYFYVDINKFKLPRKYALLVPGGSVGRPKKKWPVNKYLKVVKYFSMQNITTVIVGGKDELILFKKINREEFNFVNLIGKTNYFQLVSLAKHSICIIGNDTGPMHLLSASSSRNAVKIILFGYDSDPKLCAPVGSNIKIIRKKNIKDIKVNEVTKLINLKKI